MSRPFRLTLVHPCIGRRPGEPYLRSWQMEPLPCALVAALTPRGVALRFHDDRLEEIPFDAPADLVAISVETYTAKRAYQIASEYRRRGVPVVMGGFHATLCPDEVSEFAESVVVGEAEDVWGEVVEDYRAGTPRKIYRADARPSLERSTPDRSIFAGRRYLPLSLVEVGRGCRFSCEFCSVQTVFGRSYSRRPIGAVVQEILDLRRRSNPRLFFFVDDNFIASPEEAKEVLRAIAPLGIRWVSQASVHVAEDEELLALLGRSGCAGLLVGFESLSDGNLRQMRKGFNISADGHARALSRLARHGIRIYATFLFGYDEDSEETLCRSIAFAREHAFYIAAFNHVTPFPGTALYRRLEAEGRLLHDRWWLDDAYRYNQIPFTPARLSPESLRRGCLVARRAFYSPSSILRRGLHPVNRSSPFMLGTFFFLNLLFRREVDQRDRFPLGDGSFAGPLLRAA